MNNVIHLPGAEPREENIRALQRVLPECVRAAVAEVGEDGFKAFFDGYKDSVESRLQAA